MVIPDHILGRLCADSQLPLVEPMPLAADFGPCSIDLRLDEVFYSPDARRIPQPMNLGMARNDLWRRLSYFAGPAQHEGGMVLMPGQHALGQTMETIHMPSGLLGVVDGRSILGRFGLAVHLTAQHIHPGWEGKLTLEFSNVGQSFLKLQSGMKICSVFFYRLEAEPENIHGGRPNAYFNG